MGGRLREGHVVVGGVVPIQVKDFLTQQVRDGRFPTVSKAVCYYLSLAARTSAGDSPSSEAQPKTYRSDRAVKQVFVAKVGDMKDPEGIRQEDGVGRPSSSVRAGGKLLKALRDIGDNVRRKLNVPSQTTHLEETSERLVQGPRFGSKVPSESETTVVGKSTSRKNGRLANREKAQSSPRKSCVTGGERPSDK